MDKNNYSVAYLNALSKKVGKDTSSVVLQPHGLQEAPTFTNSKNSVIKRLTKENILNSVMDKQKANKYIIQKDLGN